MAKAQGRTQGMRLMRWLFPAYKVPVANLVIALALAACMTVGGVLASGIGSGGLTRQLVMQSATTAATWAVAFFLGMQVVEACFVDPPRAPSRPPIRFAWARWAFERHPFIVPFICILVCWMPYLVICFPGTTDPFDTLDQLQQFNGIMSATAQNVQLINPDIFLNNHHPVFHTVLVGSFVNLGAALGSQSVGLFLFVLLQTGLLAAGFAGMVSLQREFRTPLWARIVMLAIACFVPLFPSWAVCVAKDTLFTAFILLYLVVLVRFMLNPNLLHKPLWIMTFILSSILVCLTRNNGVFVVLFTAVALLIAYRKKPLRTLGALSCAVVVCFALYTSVLLPVLGVSPGSVREALSLPTQQVAYVTTSDPAGITEDQQQAIARVYDYQTMPLLYNPQNADLVKNGYNPSATTQDALAFLGAWAQIGLSHPAGYTIAFCANTYAWVDPGVETSFVWLRTNCWGMTADMGIDDQYRESGFNFDQNSSLEQTRNDLYSWFRSYWASPLRLLTNEALCIWVLIFALCLVLRRGPRAHAVAFVPCFAIFLVCLASPINGLARYALPYVAATPFLLAFAYASVRQGRGAHEESTDKAAAGPDSCDTVTVDIQSEGV